MLDVAQTWSPHLKRAEGDLQRQATSSTATSSRQRYSFFFGSRRMNLYSLLSTCRRKGLYATTVGLPRSDSSFRAAAIYAAGQKLWEVRNGCGLTNLLMLEDEQSPSSLSGECDVHQGRYCTQACFLGPAWKHPLDKDCLDVSAHRVHANTNRHAMEQKTFAWRTQHKLEENLGSGCEPLTHWTMSFWTCWIGLGSTKGIRWRTSSASWLRRLGVRGVRSARTCR